MNLSDVALASADMIVSAAWIFVAGAALYGAYVVAKWGANRGR